MYYAGPCLPDTVFSVLLIFNVVFVVRWWGFKLVIVRFVELKLYNPSRLRRGTCRTGCGTKTREVSDEPHVRILENP